jgi:dTMP kinase
MLTLAARAQHVSERIRPALDAGRDVVGDRFSASTLAYQGFGRRLPVSEIRRACDLATGGLWPDLTLLLHVPLEVGAARKAAVGSRPDRFESQGGGFHARVAEGFLALAAEDPGWVVIDGTGAEDDVARLVLEAVDSELGRRAAG